MNIFLLSFIAAIMLSAAQGKQTFTGTITNDECGRADHSRMRMAPTDAACIQACISAHSGSYVLYDGKDVYTLSEISADHNLPVDLFPRRQPLIEVG